MSKINFLEPNTTIFLFQKDFEKNIKEIGSDVHSKSTGKRLTDQELDAIIKRIRNQRDTMTEVRYNFIFAQNQLSEINEKLKSLDNLGDGLRVFDYEQLQAEVQSLSDKIEERNKELTKLRLRCNGHTQILAHVREKVYELIETIEKERTNLNIVSSNVQSLREDVNLSYKDREGLRKKLSQIDNDCGLLNKPLLMRDYDKIEKALNETKLVVEGIERENQEMNHEISRLKNILGDESLKKTESQIFDDQLQKDLAVIGITYPIE